MSVKFVIVAFLCAILFVLGKALYHLVSNKRNSKLLANALTLRIALSIALVVLIGAAYALGLIEPHGLVAR